MVFIFISGIKIETNASRERRIWESALSKSEACFYTANYVPYLTKYINLADLSSVQFDQRPITMDAHTILSSNLR